MEYCIRNFGADLPLGKFDNIYRKKSKMVK
jgi:hypothetical protein